MERFGPVVDQAWVHGERAYIHLQLQQYEQVIESATKAIALRPAASQYQNRGLAYEHLGRLPEAEADFGSAIGLEPGKATRYKERAMFYRNAKRNADALPDLQSALVLQPDDPELLLYRADAWIALKRRQKCVADLRKVVEVEAAGPNRDGALERLKLLGEKA